MRFLLAACISSLAIISSAAQDEDRIPLARLISTSRLTLPGLVDSNVPLIWDLADGEWELRAMTTFGGIPKLSIGPSIERLSPGEPITIESHPGHGIWMAASSGTIRALGTATITTSCPCAGASIGLPRRLER